MTKRDKCAGGIIIFPHFDNIQLIDNYKILIVKQKYNNYWGLPKGHLETNENIYDAAIREIHEETNIDLKSLEIYKDYDEVIVNHHKANNLIVIKKIFFFVFTILKTNFTHKKIKNNEIIDTKWITLSQLKSNSFNFKLNRTLSNDSIYQLESLCSHTMNLLINKYLLYNLEDLK